MRICDKCGEKTHTIKRYGWDLCYGCANHINRLMHYGEKIKHVR